jgi:hypothetical protein
MDVRLWMLDGLVSTHCNICGSGQCSVTRLGAILPFGLLWATFYLTIFFYLNKVFSHIVCCWYFKVSNAV